MIGRRLLRLQPKKALVLDTRALLGLRYDPGSKEVKMTIHRAALIAGLLAASALGGCDKGGDSQGAGRRYRERRRHHDPRAQFSELALARPPADVPRKTVEQVVLARVIERKLLADAARDRKLDKNPDFILAERRGDEGLLVQALQGDIVRKVPPPTREAAEKYIEAHPDQFAQRKIYMIDQIQFLRPGNIAAMGLEKANTLGDVDRSC